MTTAEVQKRYSDTIEAAIAMARATRDCSAVAAPDGAEVYAYPKSEGRIAWGVNAAHTPIRSRKAASPGASTLLRQR
jgi:hypothetical protein